MKFINLAKRLSRFLERNNVCEYSTFILVTMPDGFQFVTESASFANKMIANYHAQTRHIIEIGE
jgi:hypothetical protein